MSEILQKLNPSRDLQVYFERPSASAALSGATETGFTVSGTWRQQFDWAVVEWNRDNVFEPHFIRSLPDGDLSGLTLTYDESRENCISVDSDLFPTVDWNVLRIWTRDSSGDDFFKVNLKPLASPIEGAYSCAMASLTLSGTATAGDYVGLSLLDEHYTYEVQALDSIQSIIAAITGIVNSFSSYVGATSSDATITLIYRGVGFTVTDSTVGANGNRVGVYGFVSGARTEVWSPVSAVFSGGSSPSGWRYTIPFGALTATDGRSVPAQHVRKLRWTYAAELQAGAYERSEFSVSVSNWTVSGSGRAYTVTGPSSKRYEDSDAPWVFEGAWIKSIGNFSGSTIHHTVWTGARATLTYELHHEHELALGSRLSFNGAGVHVWVDGTLVRSESLLLEGEDQLARLLLGAQGPGVHTVEVAHSGPDGAFLYLDYVEAFVRQSEIEPFSADAQINLATDWDTDHSLAIPAERTAWLIHFLGFHGRVNHYVGALWFYELIRTGHQYANVTVEFVGTPAFSGVTAIMIGRNGYPAETNLIATHLNRIGDTAETIAKAFELEFNRGYTAIRAVASGNVLTILSRSMGQDGNELHISATPGSGAFRVSLSSGNFAGGQDGTWHTDLNALPRMNRACRDWSLAFFRCMKQYQLPVTCAFSMELQHGDTALAAGIAQRYPNGTAVYLNTPALQTNFSPVSTSFWRDVYRGMADLMAAEDLVPYLQFGEVQWWYFPLAASGMTFYDEYSMSRFQVEHGRPMQMIESHMVDPAPYVEECAFLSNLIGEFTAAVMNYVRDGHPSAKFEVLYPTDVNETPLNGLVNYPAAHWTPATLDCLKTESFTYTFLRNVDLGRITVEYGKTRGFPADKRAFLCGIGDSSTAWRTEVALAKGENMESITLFALDQYCLIGYDTPLRLTHTRSFQQS